MAQKAATISERQHQLNEYFGEKEYKLLSYAGLREMAKLKHKCGTIIEKKYQYFQHAINKKLNICPCTFQKTGPQAKSIEERQSELNKLFNKSYKITHYEHTNKLLIVRHSCGYEFSTFWQSLVDKTSNSKCRCLQIKTPYLTLKQHQKEISNRYGTDYKVIKYEWGENKVNTYKHLLCGHIWQASRTSALHHARHCPACRGPSGANINRNTIEEVEAIINKNSKRKYNVVKYTYASAAIEIECRECEHKQRIFISNKRQFIKGFKCQGCGDSVALTKIILNNKKFVLRGYEPQALKVLVAEGYDVKNIYHKRKNVPRFDYIYNNKRHRYQPDFYIKSENLIIEVKSVYTLGLTNDDKIHGIRSFDRNKAKCKAVLDKGFNFRLIIISDNGKLVPMPSNWHTKRRLNLMKHMRTSAD